MKYIVIVPDGAADENIETHDGKTVFELAATPTLDAMAREGSLGLARTVPEGLHPGSDVANLALLGYDPREGFSGRAALEAASLGIEIPEGSAAFRANLVTIDDEGRMVDYSAGHISFEEGKELIEQLNAELEVDDVRLFAGNGYRHICLMDNVGANIPTCTPPHDILGEIASEHLPQGQFASWILEVENASAELLPKYGVNLHRASEGLPMATQLWLWGGATGMHLENFAKRYGLGSAGMISAVDLMRGIGKLTGMDVLRVDGATGYLDTNYAGKGRAALDYIYMHDFVVVHIEAPDEAGHNGDLEAKVEALEAIDRHIVAPLYAMGKHYGDWRIMIAPDHPTPVSQRTHTSDPVPYVFWGSDFSGNGAKAFNEKEAARVGGDIADGLELIGRFLVKADSATASDAVEGE